MSEELEVKDQWKLDRWGMFTASEEWKLTISGKFDKATQTTPMFGDTGLTYIREKATEAYTIFSEDENPETYIMKMGKIREGGSFAWLCKELGREDVLTYYGGANPLFVPYAPYKNDSGTSPDAVAWKDEAARIASFGAELKNPTRKVHGEYLTTIKDNRTLKDVSIIYFTQIQKQMMTFGCDTWLFCSHHEHFPPKNRMHIVEITADKNFQNELDARLDSAIKMKHEIISIWENL